MKKYLIVAALFYAFISGNETIAQDPKVAFVSSDSILLSLPEYKTQIKIYESYGKQLQSQMESKRKEMDDKIADFRQNAANWIPEVLQERQREIQQMEQGLQQFSQQAQVNLSKKEQELMKPLLEKIQKGIDEVASEQNIDYVVQKQMFLYASPEFDITSSVIEKLGGTPGAGAASSE